MNWWSGNSLGKTIVLVFGIVVVLSFKAGASTQPLAQCMENPLQALVVEVHALRVAMEQQATISPRIQLSMARLNIEEQRMTQLSQQVDQVRSQLSVVALESQRIAERLAEIDKTLLTERDPKKREEIAQLKNELLSRQKDQSAREQQLRVRETEAARAHDIEHARWIEFNHRIDELERLLIPLAKPQ
jgi:hypothetical protein